MMCSFEKKRRRSAASSDRWCTSSSKPRGTLKWMLVAISRRLRSDSP
jgi:hypothetical protein